MVRDLRWYYKLILGSLSNSYKAIMAACTHWVRPCGLGPWTPPWWPFPGPSGLRRPGSACRLSSVLIRPTVGWFLPLPALLLLQPRYFYTENGLLSKLLNVIFTVQICLVKKSHYINISLTPWFPKFLTNEL